ncbi:TOBE domain protein [compost metagenome]
MYIRPENVRFAGEADAATDALVEESTFLGSMRRTLVRTESGELIRLQHAPGIQPAFGDRVRIALAPEPVAVHPRG